MLNTWIYKLQKWSETHTWRKGVSHQTSPINLLINILKLCILSETKMANWLSRRNLVKQSLLDSAGGKRVLLKILALFTEEIFVSLHCATDVRKQQSQTARAEERILTGYTENKWSFTLAYTIFSIKLAPVLDNILEGVGVRGHVNNSWTKATQTTDNVSKSFCNHHHFDFHCHVFLTKLSKQKQCSKWKIYGQEAKDHTDWSPFSLNPQNQGKKKNLEKISTLFSKQNYSF